MITLTLLYPGQTLPVQHWSFETEPVIRIGRSPDNDVVLYSVVVSRHHLEIQRDGSDWKIVNLGANGTYVDGKSIKTVPVIDGMIVRIARSGPQIQIRLQSGTSALKSSSIQRQQSVSKEERTETERVKPSDKDKLLTIFDAEAFINEKNNS